MFASANNIDADEYYYRRLRRWQPDRGSLHYTVISELHNLMLYTIHTCTRHIVGTTALGGVSCGQFVSGDVAFVFKKKFSAKIFQQITGARQFVEQEIFFLYLFLFLRT